jgi:hypothetical protein
MKKSLRTFDQVVEYSNHPRSPSLIVRKKQRLGVCLWVVSVIWLNVSESEAVILIPQTTKPCPACCWNVLDYVGTSLNNGRARRFVQSEQVSFLKPVVVSSPKSLNLTAQQNTKGTPSAGTFASNREAMRPKPDCESDNQADASSKKVCGWCVHLTVILTCACVGALLGWVTGLWRAKSN